MQLLAVLSIIASVALSAHANCQLDLVFLLDSSQSVTEMKFDTVKGMVRKIVGMRSAIGPLDTQVSLITFNNDAKVASYLNEAHDIHSLEESIDNLRYTPGLTNTNEAFVMTYEKIMTTDKGMRDGSKRAIVLISDGAYTQGSVDPAAMAKKLRDEFSASILAIGIEGMNGRNTGAFHRQLTEITGDESNVYDANTYEESLKKKLDSLC